MKLAKMVGKLNLKMKDLESRFEGTGEKERSIPPDPSSDPETEGTEKPLEEDTFIDDRESEIWENDSEEDLPPILEMATSPSGYYRRILQHQPRSEIFTFRKPEGVRLSDGARLIDVPVDCRPVRSAIKSKMLKQAYDALYSVGLFVERYGSAIALAMDAGQDVRRLSQFLLGDLVAPVSKMVANTCHIISLYTGDQQEDRDLASYGLVLASPKESISLAPIAQQLGDLRRQAAEKGVKDASRKTMSSLVQHLRGGDKRVSSSPRWGSKPFTPDAQQRKPRAGSGTDGESVAQQRGGRRRKRAAAATGAAGGGRQVSAASHDGAAQADV